MTDRDPEVHGPKHYDGDACMQVLEAAGFGRGGCLFNIGKYLWRVGDKGKPVQDAQKALWYARRFAEQYAYGTLITEYEFRALVKCWDHGKQKLVPGTRQHADVSGIVVEILDAIASFMDIK